MRLEKLQKFSKNDSSQPKTMRPNTTTSYRNWKSNMGWELTHVAMSRDNKDQS
jgi:hypothetical protein